MVAWIENFLVHGEGDMQGQPFRLETWQKKFLFQLYEYDPATNRRIKRKALLGLPKGNGKTELMAAIGLAELASPIAPPSPDIPVAAAAYKQADLLFRAASYMVTEGPLADEFECYQDKIVFRNGTPGRLYKVAAEAGTIDGLRPTCFIADEVHEWTGAKERVHLVISNGLAKRSNGLELNISTAGWNRDSLLGRLYEYGTKVQSGEIEDPTFLFKWHNASDKWDLNDETELRAAIAEANPASFVNHDNLVYRFRDPNVRENEFRRYFLNQWTAAESKWLDPRDWLKLAKPERTIPERARVVLGFDGSHSQDATALVVVSVADVPHVDVVGLWERPEDKPDWTVSYDEVIGAIEAACRKWQVVEIACDPWFWVRALEDLRAAGLPVVEFPQAGELIPRATGRFQEAVKAQRITHANDARLNRHVANATVKETRYGPRLVKEKNSSRRADDLAIATIMAYERATQHSPGEYLPPVMTDLDFLAAARGETPWSRT